MIGVVAFMFAVAIADYLYQRFEFMKQMRMSRQEIRDEHKQSEGDPQVKSRLRQIRAERARRRMMAAVPEADVVITNPTHYAVALKYDQSTMEAPRAEIGREHVCPVTKAHLVGRVRRATKKQEKK